MKSKTLYQAVLGENVTTSQEGPTQTSFTLHAVSLFRCLILIILCKAKARKQQGQVISSTSRKSFNASECPMSSQGLPLPHEANAEV